MSEIQEQEKPLVGQLAHAAAEILLQDDAASGADPRELLTATTDHVVIEFEKHLGRFPGKADQRLVIPAAIAATHTYLLQQANELGLLYTFGYTDVCPDAVIEQLVALDVLIVDIRYSPSSRVAKWRQAQLQERLGDHYLHVQALGNVNYNRPGPIQLYQAEVGVGLAGERLQQGQHLAFMCMCRELHGCHREVAAQKVLERFPALKVIHL